MDKEHLIPAGELCTVYRIEQSFIGSLGEYGLIEITMVEGAPFIDRAKLPELERLIRLHYELNVNLEGLDVIANLLERVNTMQQELNVLRNRLRFYETE